MQTPSHLTSLNSARRKERKKNLVDMKNTSYENRPNVFIYSKKDSVIVTLYVDQPIYKLTVNLKTDYIRVTWRHKSDLQIIHNKKIKVEIGSYRQPHLLWQLKNNTLLINLTEQSSVRNLRMKSSN